MENQGKILAARQKEKNIPFYLDAQALHGLVERIAGPRYAEKLRFSQISPRDTGMDRYRISDDADGSIRIEATSGVAAASAFRCYLENYCDSYVGPLTRRLQLPEEPPQVGRSIEKNSICLYRYCLNYCTFGYTMLFWKWEQWEPFLDYLMLAGYNLVLNPLGNESVWLAVLEELGYSVEEAREFLASPAIFPWQCMMNITGWTGAAPAAYYEKRLALAKQIQARLRSFGAQIVVPGWSGMVPSDFQTHFPDSAPLQQGLWSRMPRPALLLPTDPHFTQVGNAYYRHLRALFGDELFYFSTDPFHEGGDSRQVALPEYAKACLERMYQASERPVWFLQGWQKNPLRDMLRALPRENVLIANLRAVDAQVADDFAGYPWLYGTVNNFGGQRTLRGNLNALLRDTLGSVADERLTVVGFGVLPEAVEIDEVLFDALADCAFREESPEPDLWLKKHIAIRYGLCPENIFQAWKLLKDQVYVGDTGSIPRDSGLCARPSLEVRGVCGPPHPFNYDIRVLPRAFALLLQGGVPLSEPYRLDILDVASQVVRNASWAAIEGIQQAYRRRDAQALETAAGELMKLYDLQEGLTACDRHTLLGPWLEMARNNGETPAEKAYFSFLARTLITLWGDREGSIELHDYAAREWSGMLEDFYRPRWESFVNCLRWSLVTGREAMQFQWYDAEFFFTTLSKTYPTEPWGDFQGALAAVSTHFHKEAVI